jgi:Fic family protein
MKVLLMNLTQRIREEFEEVPGLRVSVAEAAHFWGLDVRTSEEVLTRLLEMGFLSKGVDGRYRQVRPDHP